jgi:hypothetical protein
MQVPLDSLEGAEYFKNIIESSRTLKLGNIRPLNQGDSYLFEIAGYGKSFDVFLTREQINDLPGTKSYHAPALSLARGLDSRFKNVDPNLYMTAEGRLLKIEIESPPRPWMNPSGTAYIAASGVWVHISDFLTNEMARCAVVITYSQSMGSDPFSRPASIINTVRAAVDDKKITFYAKHEDIPNHENTVINLGYSNYRPVPSLQRFLTDKVWLLGFKAGGRQRQAWISDPWDASYLGCTTDDLEQAAAVLDAQEKIVSDEEGKFAHVGKGLLATDGPLQIIVTSSVPQFRTALGAYTVGKSLGEGGSGRVFEALDENGVVHALKYLKPENQSTQKLKRFIPTSSRLKIGGLLTWMGSKCRSMLCLCFRRH